MNSDIGQPRRRDTFADEHNALPTSHEMSHIPSLSHGVVEGSPYSVQAADPAWTERHTVKKQYLTIPEAASLIVNKMIGTGIFTTPGMVLSLTQNKTLALSFWVVGGLYAAICLLVYLDYGTGLRFNGAELIYLTRIYHTIKFKMLPPILFASFFVLLYHTAGNAISFARYVIIAGSEPNANGYYDPNNILVKAFAVFVLAIVCFFLWVSPRSGLVLSKTIAAYKIILLIVLGCWGIAARNYNVDYEPTKDWGYQETEFSHTSIQRLSAFIYVVYSYNGWENACYVIGQIDKSDSPWRRKIRWGGMMAVFLVSVAYSILTLGYYISCEYADINDNIHKARDLGIARVFSDKVLHSTKGLAVNVALSGFGNLVAVAYTQTKVKQAIALHHFLPFSTFFGCDKPFDTPGGALLLHWGMSTIFTVATPTNADGYAFLIGLVTYGQLIIATFVGLGRFKLSDAIKRAKLDTQGWKPWIHSRTVNYGAGFVLAGANILLLVAASWPIKDMTDDGNKTIPRFYWPIVLGGCLCGGFFYWYILRLLQGEVGEWLGWEWKVRQTKEESEFDQCLKMTRRDGTEERYDYSVTKNSFADLVRRGWYGFWTWLEKNL